MYIACSYIYTHDQKIIGKNEQIICINFKLKTNNTN